MLESKISAAQDPALRGWQVLYRPGETNRCPGCGRAHWYIGRFSAECGFCGTAIALATTGMTGIGVLRQPDVRLDQAA